MKKIILLLLISGSLFAQASRTTINSRIRDYHAGWDHAFVLFQDSSVTITADSGTWYTIANASKDLWQDTDTDGFTLSGDTLYFATAGHYYGHAAITFTGANGDDYEFRVRKNKATSVVEIEMGVAANASGGFISFPFYLEALATDTLYVELRNVTNGNDPTLTDGILFINYMHR